MSITMKERKRFMAMSSDAVVVEIEARNERLKKPFDLPARSDMFEAIYGCLSSRSGGWRKSMPPYRKGPETDERRLLFQLVRFHSGNGSLWGFPWFADKVVRDRFDSMAILFLGRSRAGEAWQRAMTGR